MVGGGSNSVQVGELLADRGDGGGVEDEAPGGDVVLDNASGCLEAGEVDRGEELGGVEARIDDVGVATGGGGPGVEESEEGEGVHDLVGDQQAEG